MQFHQQCINSKLFHTKCSVIIFHEAKFSCQTMKCNLCVKCCTMCAPIVAFSQCLAIRDFWIVKYSAMEAMMSTIGFLVHKWWLYRCHSCQRVNYTMYYQHSITNAILMSRKHLRQTLLLTQQDQYSLVYSENRCLFVLFCFCFFLDSIHSD